MFKKIIVAAFLLSGVCFAAEIDHLCYEVNYEESSNKVNWVRWTLTKQMLEKTESRKNNFTDDPLTEKIEKDDPYKNSGYDRGHLCPSADMLFSETAQEECFYLTNIVPQTPNLNRSLWKKTEEITRDMVKQGWYAVIYAGCIYPEYTIYLDKNLTVPIPEYCWKVMIFTKCKTTICLAFKFPNSGRLENKIDDYIVHINELPCPAVPKERGEGEGSYCIILKKEK